MAKKTVADLLKELPGTDRKDIFAYLEKQGKGKVSTKTALSDEDIEHTKEHYGQGPRPQVTIGEEVVRTQNVVDESGATTQETVREVRTTGNLIRRRKVKQEVTIEETAELSLEGDDGLPPPAEMLGDWSEDLPPLPLETPIAPSPVEPPPPAEPVVAAPPPTPLPQPPQPTIQRIVPPPQPTAKAPGMA